MESNQRYYRRRAFEERIAAQRAVTEAARAWHSKLAEDFAARAIDNAPTSALAYGDFFWASATPRSA